MTLALRRVLVMGAVAALVALAAIGVARATAPAASPVAKAAPLDPAAGAQAPASATAAADDILGADLDAILAADQASPSSAPRAGVVARGQLRHLAAWNRLVHATVVVDLKQGGLTTVQLDHGTITTLGSATLTISEAGGGSVTVTIADRTRVRRDGAKATLAALKTGDDVFVISKVEAGGTAAYLVVVPRS